MRTSRLTRILCAGVLAVALVSCSDNGTGPEVEPDEPPQTPEFQQAQPEVDFFTNTGYQGEAPQDAPFNKAYSQVIEGQAYLSLGNVFLGFFNPQQSDPDFDDGSWEWTYSYSYEGESWEMRSVAQEQGDGSISWALYITTTSAEGPNLDNFLFMDGTTSADGSSGSWNIYDFESGSSQSVMSFTWNRTGPDNYTSSFTINGSETVTIDYTQDGADHTMEIASSGGTQDAVVVWNTDTGAGSITEGGTTSCWDSSYQEVACS